MVEQVQKIWSYFPKKIAQDGAWVIGGKVIIFILSFAFITGLANLVPREVVGSYNYIISVLAIVSISTLPGMGLALVRAVSHGNEGSVFRMAQLRMLWGIGGVFAALAFGIYYLAHGVPLLGWAFIVAAPFVPFTDTLNEIAYFFLQGRKSFKKSMILAVLVQAGFSLPTLGVLFITHNLIIIIAVFFTCQALGGFIAYRTIHVHDHRIDHESVRFGFHLTAINALRLVAMNIDRIIVWIILGPVPVAIYYYAIAPMNKLEQLVPIETLALPNLSNQPFTHEVRKKMLRRTGLLVLAIIPIVIIGILLTEPVFGILFPKFPESIPLFQLLLIGLIFMPFMLLRTGFMAWKKEKSLYVLETISPIVRILLMLVFGFTFGITGVVIAILISKAVESTLIVFLFLRSRIIAQ